MNLLALAYDVLLIRYGEIGLKGRNRPAFEGQLAKGLERALAPFPGASLRREYGRFVVDLRGLANEALPKAIERVRKVFGVVSVSPALERPLSMEALEEGAGALVEKAAKMPATFKVETRRPNKRFPLSSPQVSARLGASLLRRFPALSVDVHDPAFTVNVEVRERSSYIYLESLPGPGGLPVGSSSRGLLLLSGGIDSPVAGWLAMKRGIRLDAVHFHSPPFTSERSREKVMDLAGILSECAPDPIPVHVVRFTEVQTAIRKCAPPSMGITLMRRMMLRIAERIARSEGIVALVTGESVGQVASQTLESMAAINAVTNMPVLRPLVAADKSEIIALAKQIGTYDTSILPYEDCCTLFVPENPETKPRLDRIESVEERMDIEALVEQALASTERAVPDQKPAHAPV